MQVQAAVALPERAIGLFCFPVANQQKMHLEKKAWLEPSWEKRLCGRALQARGTKAGSSPPESAPSPRVPRLLTPAWGVVHWPHTAKPAPGCRLSRAAALQATSTSHPGEGLALRSRDRSHSSVSSDTAATLTAPPSPRGSVTAMVLGSISARIQFLVRYLCIFLQGDILLRVHLRSPAGTLEMCLLCLGQKANPEEVESTFVSSHIPTRSVCCSKGTDCPSHCPGEYRSKRKTLPGLSCNAQSDAAGNSSHLGQQQPLFPLRGRP